MCRSLRAFSMAAVEDKRRLHSHRIACPQSRLRSHVTKICSALRNCAKPRRAQVQLMRLQPTAGSSSSKASRMFRRHCDRVKAGVAGAVVTLLPTGCIEQAGAEEALVACCAGRRDMATHACLIPNPPTRPPTRPPIDLPLRPLKAKTSDGLVAGGMLPAATIR